MLLRCEMRLRNEVKCLCDFDWVDPILVLICTAIKCSKNVEKIAQKVLKNLRTNVWQNCEMNSIRMQCECEFVFFSFRLNLCGIRVNQTLYSCDNGYGSFARKKIHLSVKKGREKKPCVYIWFNKFRVIFFSAFFVKNWLLFTAIANCTPFGVSYSPVSYSVEWCEFHHLFRRPFRACLLSAGDLWQFWSYRTTATLPWIINRRN